ncbi:MAG: oligosaccharide flippase family protein [Patescibacteria group bacterium]|jgi:O-antigen/teichoic acid export membrane protein
MSNKFQDKIYNLLRRSEKYTKTDMVYLAKGGFWLSISQVISSVSSFLLAIAFANLLPVETYGQYKYIISIFSILSMTTLNGMDSSVTRAVAKGFEGSLLSALKTKIKWGLIGATASLAMAIYYYLNNNYDLMVSFALISIVVPLIDSLALYQSYFNGKKWFDKLTKYTVFTKIISSLCIFLTIYLVDNLFLVVASFFIPLLILRIIYFIHIKNRYPPNKEVDTQTVKYGKHLSFVGILGTVAMQIDKILVFHYLGATELAIYAFAVAPLEQMKSLVKPITTLAAPKFATKTKKEIKDTLIKKMAKLSFLLVIVAIVYIILAPYIFQLIFPKYMEAVFYSRIFAISFITLPLLTITSVFEAQKMLKEIYLFKIVSSSVQIVLIFVLVLNFGLLGIVLARVITRFFNLFLSITFLKLSKD